MLATLFQPRHPVRGGRAVAFGGVARVAGQDEIPDLVEVAVMPASRHQHEREHMIDGHPASPDVGELALAVGAAAVLIAAQGGPDDQVVDQQGRVGNPLAVVVAGRALIQVGPELGRRLHDSIIVPPTHDLPASSPQPIDSLVETIVLAKSDAE